MIKQQWQEDIRILTKVETTQWMEHTHRITNQRITNRVDEVQEDDRKGTRGKMKLRQLFKNAIFSEEI